MLEENEATSGERSSDIASVKENLTAEIGRLAKRVLALEGRDGDEPAGHEWYDGAYAPDCPPDSNWTEERERQMTAIEDGLRRLEGEMFSTAARLREVQPEIDQLHGVTITVGHQLSDMSLTLARERDIRQKTIVDLRKQVAEALRSITNKDVEIATLRARLIEFLNAPPENEQHAENE